MNNIESNLNIPYVKLKFYLIFPEPVILPKEKVSALRGGMGEMLLQQNCIQSRDCKNCYFENACIVRKTLYTQMEKKPAFMQGDDSIGYLIECENYRTEFEAGEELFFCLTLFGRNIVYFGQYLQAFYRLGIVGIGKHRARYHISRIVNQKKQCILQNNVVNMEIFQISTVFEYAKMRVGHIKKNGCRNELVFRTPLCLKYQGEYIQEFCSEAIFQALSRRIMMMNYFVENYIEQPEISSYPSVVRQNMNFRMIKRYSSTQDTKIMLRGIEGKVCFDQIPEDYLLYVLGGELLHIGKNSSFGFGRYFLR